MEIKPLHGIIGQREEKIKMNNIISVIVPVYNVEKYIEKCLNSIINQTFQNFEVILVDDGSTDASGVICDEFTKKDDRFRVIHRENGGLSAARNTGINAAKGEYITFVDSDDWIKKELLGQLIILLESNGADISECSFFSDEKTIFNEEEQIYCYSNKEYMIRLLEDKIPGSSFFCGKLFKKELFYNNFFSVDKKNCEDLFLMPNIIQKAAQIVVTNKRYYFYYQRPNSNMNNPNNYIKNQIAIAQAFRIRYGLACNDYKEAEKSALKKAATASMCAFCLIWNLKKKDKELEEELESNYQFIKRDYSKIKINNEVSIWYKIGAAIMLSYPKIYCKIVEYLMRIKNILKKIRICIIPLI